MTSRTTCRSRLCVLWTRVLLRLFQFCSSLVAYVVLQTACVTTKRTTGNRTVAVVATSKAIDFAMVINFLAFVYAFIFLIFIEWLRMCNRPLHRWEKGLNLVAFVCLAVATFVLLLSDISLNCRTRYGSFLHCGDLYVGIAMSLLSTLSFLALVLFEWCAEGRQKRQQDYEAQRPDEQGSGAYSYHASPRGSTPVPVVTAHPPVFT